MICYAPNYAKPFRKIPTAWAPQRLHLILQALTPLPADQRMYCRRDRDVACHYWQEVSFFQLAFSKAARPFWITKESPFGLVKVKLTPEFASDEIGFSAQDRQAPSRWTRSPFPLSRSLGLNRASKLLRETVALTAPDTRVKSSLP
jgi:hypothetical protein